MNDSSSCCDIPVFILAGGESDNFSKLGSTLIKALLKIGTKTLLQNTIDNLVVSGFKDLRIITNDELSASIQDHVITCSKDWESYNPSIEVHGISFCDHQGTTDAVRAFAKSTDTPFMVVPCDFYGKFDFKAVAREHFRSKRLCTIALVESEKKTVDNQLALGGCEVETWDYKYRVISTLDESKGQIVGISQAISVESGEKHEIFKWHSLKHQHCVILRNLVDVHIYVFSNDIFKMFGVYKNSSIRLDVIPFIVKMQETPVLKVCIDSGDLPGQTDEIYDKQWKRHELDNDFDDTRVFYFIGSGDSFKISRVNSIDAFYLANMRECTSKSASASGSKITKAKNTISGENPNVDSTASIKNCVFGDNVQIGANAKVTNCVVMDGCKLEGEVTLDRSVIGKSVTVGEKSKLKNVVVLSDYVIPKETLIDRDYLPPFIE
ncbi:conserved hypothetical protein [Theileria equi strain WA]|uniref:Translation initiation factor eIF2B subunit gamma n=1 Tax=Theileria equi strain WA TaxID=1537102 RepID=L1LA11_THEEQ|nr:conserved hypothetical protein [Theileria equi strain WA]EKX72060.1 conserved hypothetical protein [Theileria equi strain WA]|eukprot:XP_004831512.1 conserved hypothetical protein [Theileria equi strain WA]